jgi:hypothetical protein
MYIKSEGYIEKASKLSEGEVEFVVSTGDIDAHGERINVDGIDTKDFKKNPVVLWGHDGFNLPIAKATKIWKSDGKLMARAIFYLKDEFAKKVYDYILDGYLKAVSIAGMVQEWGNDGMTISKLLMKEFSVVSVPANANALVAAKSLNGEQKAELNSLANALARKMLKKDSGMTDIQESANTLFKLATTLKEIADGETNRETVEDVKLTRRVVLRQAQAVDQQVETVIRQIKLKGEN